MVGAVAVAKAAEEVLSVDGVGAEAPDNGLQAVDQLVGGIADTVPLEIVGIPPSRAS